MLIEKLKINYKAQKKKKPGPVHKLKTINRAMNIG
jgi:hypothetical protein